MDQQPHITINEYLIGRYLAGEAAPEEAIAVDEWLQQAPENRRQFGEMTLLWEQAFPGQSYREPDAVKAWQQLSASLVPPVESSRRSVIGRAWTIAAILVLALGLGLIAWLLLPEQATPPAGTPSAGIPSTSIPSTSIPSTSIPSSGTPSAGTLLTAGNNIVVDTLTDQSVVTLAAHSQLHLDAGFATHNRYTALEGEGYFAVQPRRHQPFTIQVGDVQVIVVGTAFNVKQDANAVTVSVSQGIVKMQSAQDSLLVKAGTTGVYHTATHTLQLLDTVHRNEFAYATGTLYFYSTPLSEVKQALETTYNVKIVLENSRLARCRLNTQFNQQSLQQVLDVIAASLGIQYRIDQQTIYFSGNECK